MFVRLGKQIVSDSFIFDYFEAADSYYQGDFFLSLDPEVYFLFISFYFLKSNDYTFADFDLPL
jgi:hypothetical protein